MSDPRRLFRSVVVLRGLNLLGVGLSMATIVGAFCGSVFSHGSFSNPAVQSTALPTFVVGVAWAALLRWERTVGARKIRVGWFLSLPLAIVNTSLCAGLLATHGEGLLTGLKGAVAFTPLAATIGVLYWGPALIGVLLAFGVPIRWAQGQAKRGLVGEERGELVVGLVVAALSAVGLVLASDRPPSSAENRLQDAIHDKYFGREAERVLPLPAWRLPDSGPTALLIAFGLLGLALGLTAAAVAWRRDRERRRFIAQVEQEKVTGFRVVESDEGRALVRVQGGDQYRSVEEEELLFALEQSAQSERLPGKQG